MANGFDWLTTQEVAENLGVSRRRVLALIASGKLPAKKVGRDWLISRSDIELVRGKTLIKRRLTEEESREIRDRYQRGESIQSIIERFSVDRATIYRHINRN